MATIKGIAERKGITTYLKIPFYHWCDEEPAGDLPVGILRQRDVSHSESKRRIIQEVRLSF